MPFLARGEGELLRHQLAIEEINRQLNSATTPEERDKILQQRDEIMSSRVPTPYDEEWIDHRALVRVLIQQGVPIDKIEEIASSNPVRSIEDLAHLNGKFFSLAEQFEIPRSWLLTEVSKKKHRKAHLQTQFTGDTNMSWLSKKAADGGPELESPLPTKSQPNLKGPADGPGLGGKPPAPKPPMGGAPGGLGMGGGPQKNPGVDQIKSLLDKGQLQEALDALKKLVPGGAGAGGPPMHKAPDLGKPKPPMGGPAGKPAMPPAGGGEGAGAPPMGHKPMASKHLMECGACHITLEASCPTCDSPLE